MTDADFILEHEILKVLYIRTSFYKIGYPMGNGKTVIISKRDYKDASLYFGTLVDILNCPDKYDDNALKAMQGMNRMMEEINTEKYNFQKVSNAIEVLVFNGQVIDNVIEHKPPQQNGSRKITLTAKGAIDYRNIFYYKEREKEISIVRSYDIQKKERWLKKYWIVVEILKYVMGGIIGAAIALAVVRINKSPESKSGNSKTSQRDTAISYTIHPNIHP